jgi:ATP-dependent DNA helicase RecQ
MDVESALRAIGKRYGYAEIKDKQRDAILAFVSGQDIFVSLPTGYGKSFCYQCLPLLFDILRSHEVPTSIVVVVTPLAAIMKDQVSDLGCKQISAIQVTSSVDEVVENEIMHGKFNIIYISPELLLRKHVWREMLRSDLFQQRMVGFIVDEAHCVKKWYVESTLIL